MIHPGLVVLLVAVVVLIQVGVIAWVEYRVTGRLSDFEARMNKRMDQLAETCERTTEALNQQMTKETALTQRYDTLLERVSIMIQSIDEAAMMPEPRPRRRRRE